MNAVVPLQPAEARIAPAALVPANMGEAMRLAEMMAGAKLVPAALQKSAADCLMVVMQAVRWQMDPFAVAQECSVIQGKLMHSGKLTLAVINARGNLRDRLRFEYQGEGDGRAVTVTGLLQGEGEPRTVSVKLRDARTNNKVWQTQPDQQLAYHGARVWARRHTPELMLGVYSPEEFDDGPQPSMKDVTPPNLRPTPTQPSAMPPHDPDTGEILGPHEIRCDDGDVIRWGRDLIAGVKGASSIAEVDEWERHNAVMIERCRNEAPKAFQRVAAAFATAREPEFVTAEEAAVLHDGASPYPDNQ